MCLKWFIEREWVWECTFVLELKSCRNSEETQVPLIIHVQKVLCQERWKKVEPPLCEGKLEAFWFLLGDSEGEAGIS